jgi:hypothetical protein
LHPYEPLRLMLERILGAAVALVPTPLAVVGIRLNRPGTALRNYRVHLGATADDAAAAAERVEAYLAGEDEPEAGAAADGYVAPFTLHDGLGDGWVYLAGVVPDPLGRLALPLLAAHAANAVYSAALRPDDASPKAVISGS